MIGTDTRESWFVDHPDSDDRVLLATSPRANYQWICSCGKHGTIASLNHAFAVNVCIAHLRWDHKATTAADPFAGIAADLDAARKDAR